MYTANIFTVPTGTPPKLEWNRCGGHEHKNLQYLRNAKRCKVRPRLLWWT